MSVTLVCAGERLFGDGPTHPTWGWYSPTYAHKVPVLAFTLVATASLPLQFTTHFILGSG